MRRILKYISSRIRYRKWKKNKSRKVNTIVNTIVVTIKAYDGYSDSQLKSMERDIDLAVSKYDYFSVKDVKIKTKRYVDRNNRGF